VRATQLTDSTWKYATQICFNLLLQQQRQQQRQPSHALYYIDLRSVRASEKATATSNKKQQQQQPLQKTRKQNWNI